ncbi:hypothetical protein MKJ04_04040 [Pontibacter sp. E15-1]|uniref:hypothetical protein n=1 Tax=Pontibacter sp. E15-1 TaxID=2919918 RepID=UPI001F4FDEEA|nr:hypothetical protein [Pontibacter sp. E15-1]MCJ8163999.1 hypothetical protein [Pontibacter sp. E15-1]
MLIKLFTVYVYLQAMLCGCGADKRNSDFERLRKDYKVTVQRIGRLESRLAESSGLARASDSTFWTHGDGGTPSALYRINLKGELLETVPLPVPNQDWEDIAEDERGNLYIGDVGNNFNNRRNLQVYKIAPEGMAVTDTIRFRYADQSAFPPPPPAQHYDLEGFFYHTDSLYLFTKSHALRKAVTRRYSLPATGGSHVLEPEEEIRLGSPVTAAALAPARNQFALLGYGRLYLFAMENSQVSFKGKRSCLPLGKTGQAEAITYLSATQLLLTNENGKLFLITLEKK